MHVHLEYNLIMLGMLPQHGTSLCVPGTYLHTYVHAATGICLYSALQGWLHQLHEAGAVK